MKLRKIAFGRQAKEPSKEPTESLPGKPSKEAGDVIPLRLSQGLATLKELDGKLSRGLSDAGRSTQHGSSMALALSYVAGELNMPETAARLERAGKTMLTERGTGDVTPNTEKQVRKLTGHISKLTRDAQADGGRVSYQAISDIAFALSEVAKDLGKVNAENYLEAAASSARSGH